MGTFKATNIHGGHASAALYMGGVEHSEGKHAAQSYDSRRLTALQLYHEEERTKGGASPIAELAGRVLYLYENCFDYLDFLLGLGLI